MAKTFILSPLFVKARPDTGHDRTGARTGSPKGGGSPPRNRSPGGGPRKASQNPPNGREGGLHLRGSVMSLANSGRGGLKRANLGRGGLTLPIRGVAALNVPCALQAGMRPEGYEARGCALQAGMRPEGYQARLASVGGFTGVNHNWVKPEPGLRGRALPGLTTVGLNLSRASVRGLYQTGTHPLVPASMLEEHAHTHDWASTLKRVLPEGLCGCPRSMQPHVAPCS